MPTSAKIVWNSSASSCSSSEMVPLKSKITAPGVTSGEGERIRDRELVHTASECTSGRVPPGQRTDTRPHRPARAAGRIPFPAMQMRRLGRAGPEISVVGIGCWEAGGADWGPNSSEREVVAAIHAGLESGVNWVDTAEVYGQGLSEQIVGRALAGRDDVLVFTKVAPTEGSGLRPEQVQSAIDASLRRLGRDHVDLYQIHWPDDSVPLEETWGAMAGIVQAGKARLIGVSNFDRARVERCLAIHPVASVQNEFSLLVRDD